MTCQCGGTVWFDHKRKKWRHGSGYCETPEPRDISRQSTTRPTN